MSDSDFTNPLSPGGTHLGDEARLGLPTVRLEECGFLPRGQPWNFDGVLSPFWRLYWNPRPGSYLLVGTRRIFLRPSAVLLVPEGLRFHTRGQRGTPHLWIHFTIFPHRRPGADAATAIRVTPQIHECLRTLMRSSERKAPTFVHYHHAQSLLHAVLAEDTAFRRPRLPEMLERLLEHIDANLNQPLSNADLAAFCHRSIEGFIRWFHLHLTQSPQRYVTERRIRQASRELALTEDSIDLIAGRNGFPNRNYFTRVFTRSTGTPPAAFRTQAMPRARNEA